MGMSQYWVGQKPTRPVVIDVRDSGNARVNLTNYDTITVKMLGSDNEEIDTSGITLGSAGLSNGRLVMYWPTDGSLFDKPGDYLLQLEMTDGDALDFTTTHDIRVYKLGGKR